MRAFDGDFWAVRCVKETGPAVQAKCFVECRVRPDAARLAVNRRQTGAAKGNSGRAKSEKKAERPEQDSAVEA